MTDTGAALRDPNAALGEVNAILDDPSAALHEPSAALDVPDAALDEPNAALDDPDAVKYFGFLYAVARLLKAAIVKKAQVCDARNDAMKTLSQAQKNTYHNP